LLFGRAIVESEFTFFKEKRKGYFINVIVLSQNSFGLTPEVFDAVDVMFAFGKIRGMMDAFMLEVADIKGTIRNHSNRWTMLP